MFSCGWFRKWLASSAAAASSPPGVLADTHARCMDFLLFGNAAGGGSSTIKCALVPPMPNELTQARRGLSPVHWSSSVGTKNGEFAKSILGLGVRKLMLGGISPLLRQSAVLIRPATPATVLR